MSRPCLLAVSLALFSVAGCAAKSAPTKAPDAPNAAATPGEATSTPTEQDGLGGDTPDTNAPGPADDPVATSDPDPLQSELDALEEDELRLSQLLGEEKTAELSAGAACPRACDALASMKRSVARICELTGDDDERCGDAKTRLEAGKARVAKASCGC